jgi:hypothetical protein
MIGDYKGRGKKCPGKFFVIRKYSDWHIKETL